MGKPGTITVWIVGIVLVAIMAAMAWQHLRYQDARRNAVHDLQDVFHSSTVLHGVLFLELAPDTGLFDAMRALRATTDALPVAQTVYAGKVAMNGLASSQMVEALGEDVAWDAVALVQFDDRAGYYPGVQYLHDLTGSTFFRNIIGDKRLGDTQSTVTVPILHLL